MAPDTAITISKVLLVGLDLSRNSRDSFKISFIIEIDLKLKVGNYGDFFFHFYGVLV